MIMMDNIDSNIIKLLSRNSRSSATQISNYLSKTGISLTPRSVLNRIARLEKNKIIHSYTVKLNPCIEELLQIQELNRNKMSISVNKKLMYEPEYQQKLISQSYDEMVSSIARQFQGLA